MAGIIKSATAHKSMSFCVKIYLVNVIDKFVLIRGLELKTGSQAT